MHNFSNLLNIANIYFLYSVVPTRYKNPFYRKEKRYQNPQLLKPPTSTPEKSIEMLSIAQPINNEQKASLKW